MTTALPFDPAVLRGAQPYAIEEVEIGFVRPAPLLCAFIPRQDYVEAMDDLIDGVALPDDLKAELRKTARVATHFAMDSYMTERGCGCLVGEMFLLTGAIKRDVSTGVLMVDVNQVVVNAMEATGHGKTLADLGEGADVAVREIVAYNDPAADVDEFAVAIFLDSSTTTEDPQP